MSHPSLTPQQAELLEMLAEEAAEVVQIAMKSLRHGFDSYNPHDAKCTPNRELLRRELTDFQAVYNMLRYTNEGLHCTSLEVKTAIRKKLKYAHCQDAEKLTNG